MRAQVNRVIQQGPEPRQPNAQQGIQRIATDKNFKFSCNMMCHVCLLSAVVTQLKQLCFSNNRQMSSLFGEIVMTANLKRVSIVRCPFYIRFGLAADSVASMFSYFESHHLLPTILIYSVVIRPQCCSDLFRGTRTKYFTQQRLFSLETSALN